MKSGIYTITNTIDGKMYVGRARLLNKRLKEHSSNLLRNKHINRHLQYAVNKYGISNFHFEILDTYEVEYLPSMEHYWCLLLDVHNSERGYNIEPTHPYGKNGHSEETKLLLAIPNSGHIKKGSVPWNKGLPSPKKGTKISELTKRRIAKSKMGNTARVGKKITQEQIEILRKGRTPEVYARAVESRKRNKLLTN